jgi:large subunit ribosomal protein L23
MKDLHDIILKPVLSEKSYDLIADKKYTFLVDVRSNKTEIKQAIEQVFGVKVDRINTARRLGKVKRQRRSEGRRPETKRAFVTLKKDSKGIEFFESMQ